MSLAFFNERCILISHTVYMNARLLDPNDKLYQCVHKNHPTLYVGYTVFSVFSDHNPLTFMNKLKCKNQRLLRLRLFLQDNNPEIKHIKGKDNVLADCLSRCL